MRGIAKVINGEIQLFATEGEQNEGAPVYVFETKEDFDAAVAGNLIPIGAIIVKTYDGAEMAGGPFDGELSEESDNAVQNKVLAAKMAQLDQAIADVLALRAGLETFGLSKICPVGTTDATEDNGMVLGAREKNAALEGTLAHAISNTDEVKVKRVGLTPVEMQSNKPKNITIALDDDVASGFLAAVLSHAFPITTWIGAVVSVADVSFSGNNLTAVIVSESDNSYNIQFDVIYTVKKGALAS